MTVCTCICKYNECIYACKHVCIYVYMYYVRTSICTQAPIFAFCWRRNQGKFRNNIYSRVAAGLLSHFERFANVIFNVRVRERRECRIRVMVIRSISSADGERTVTWMKE